MPRQCPTRRRFSTCAGVCAEERPEVVHAHNWIVYSYLPLRRRQEAALVLSLHDYGLLCATKRLLWRGAPCSGPRPVKCVLCAAAPLRSPAGTGDRDRHPHRANRACGAPSTLFLPISAAVRDLCRLGRGSPPGRPELHPSRFLRRPPTPTRSAELPEEPFMLLLRRHFRRQGCAPPDRGLPHAGRAAAAGDDRTLAARRHRRSPRPHRPGPLAAPAR